MDQIKTPHRGLYDAYERCIPARPEVKSDRVALQFQGGHLEFYVQDMGLGPELNVVFSHSDGTMENRTRIKTTPASLVELGHMFLEAAATEYSEPFKAGAVAQSSVEQEVCAEIPAERIAAFVEAIRDGALEEPEPEPELISDSEFVAAIQERFSEEPPDAELTGESECSCEPVKD